MTRFRIGVVAAVLAAGALVAAQDRTGGRGEWPAYAGDAASTHYSPLADIDRAAAARLAVAWRWHPREGPLARWATQPGTFQSTPLMIDDTLYLTTPYNRVAALDARTGEEKWWFDPGAFTLGPTPNGTGFVHRGVAAWRDSRAKGALRIFLTTRQRLIALDGETGDPVPGFGDDGAVDLVKGLGRATNPRHYANTSPPVVYKDLVIVGNNVGDRLIYKNDPPGDVRAFDARTGALVWTFRPVPGRGEVGNDTWGGESWKTMGHTNVWAPMSLDEIRGLVYLPVSTPSNDFYGGARPGANLFAESLVCLDAATGQRKWHFQIVHHGLWDYDLPAAPILTTITVDGKKIDAVVQLTKQGFAFVFDRVTGVPVWPIEERAVGGSDVPGEQAWPTQPFPVKPPAFVEQGVSLDDAFDATPDIREEARRELSRFRLGPLYTPPSEQGTLMRPGVMGGANWGGGAVDPRSGLLFVKTTNVPAVARLVAPTQSPGAPSQSEQDADFVQAGASPSFSDGLPLLKTPFGHLVAIDLNRGAIAWRVPLGDTPLLRTHPRLRGVDLPERLGAAGPAGAIVTGAGLIFVGGGDEALNVVDAKTGDLVRRIPLTRRTTGTPMTYRTSAGPQGPARQFVVVATGGGEAAELVALAVPQASPAKE